MAEGVPPELQTAHDPALRLRGFRLRLVDRMFRMTALLALLYTPVLVWRISSVNWHFQLAVHAFFMLVALALFPFIERLPLWLKSAIAVGATLAMGMFGLFTMGTTGSGYFWVLISLVLTATLYSLPVAIAFAVANSGLLLLAAVGFSTGALTVPIDLHEFVASPSAWVGYFLVVNLVPLSLLYALASYRTMTEQLMGDIEAQRRQLAAVIGHDQLTGLPQNALAMDRLDRQLAAARRNAHQAALLFIDLDGFKAVNDGFGHAAGDALLAALAQRLRAAVRESDTVARVGGDEFLVILGELQQPDSAAQVAQKLIDEAAAPLGWQGHRLQVGASIGIALFPDHAQDAEGLRRAADAAMYDAKREGKNHFRFAQVVEMADAQPV